MSQSNKLNKLETELLTLLVEQPDDAYAVSLMFRHTDYTGLLRSITSIQVALRRLEERGMVESWWSATSRKRGGRRRRLYRITNSGKELLEQGNETQ